MAGLSKRIALLVCALSLAVVLVSTGASAWKANIIPVWNSPEPGALWTFSMKLNNTGNASYQVHDLTVWTDWGGTPTAAEPAHTTSSLPAVLHAGGTKNFTFTFAVPASAAGGTFRLHSRMLAADADGSGGWREPAPALFGKAFNFTVQDARQPSSLFGWTVAGLPLEYILLPVGAAAVGGSFFWVRKRRTGSRKPRPHTPSQAQPARSTPPKVP